jgi:DNA-binding CsgD family transcriptional regulator/PAS domain-containing protein
MAVLSYLYFSAFFVCVVAGAALLIGEQPGRAGRSLAGLAFALAFWALGYTGITSNLIAEHAVPTWYRIAAVGWIGFIPMVFWFVFSICHPRRPIPRWTFPFFSVWALGLLVKQWTDTIFVGGFRKLAVGWGRVGSIDSWWGVLYLVVFFALVLWTIVSLVRAIRGTPQPAVRHPLVVILIGLLFNYAAGTANVLLLATLGASIPNVLVVPVFITILVVSFMMVRHRFLLTDYRPIMEEIMDTLTDAVIIADANGLITRMNRTARECCRVSGEPEFTNLEEIVHTDVLVQALDDAGAYRSLPGYLPLAGHFDCDGEEMRAIVHPITDGRLGLKHIVLVIPIGDRDVRFLKAHGFTRQEITVAKLVLAGYTNTEIAEQLFVSYGTVKHHVSSIFSKLGVNNRSTFMRRVQSEDCDSSRLPATRADG